MREDSELLRRYADAGDDAAFTEFVQRHLGLVYSIAVRQAHGNRTLAEDITQRVFTDLARKAPRLASHPSLLGWLHTATRLAAMKALRQEARRLGRETEAHAMDQIEREDNRPAQSSLPPVEPLLDDILAGLREREREALLLRYHGGCSYSEIGHRLALTETAARSCVDRAVERLRARFAARGIHSSGAALMAALAAEATAATPAGLAASVATAALTAGAVTGAVTIFTPLAMNKTIVAVGTAVVAGLLTAVVLESRTQTRLQREVAQLQAANDSRTRPATATVASADDTREFARLTARREELRSQLSAAEEPAPPASRMKKQGDWKNAGFDTPENAFETIAWAMFNRDWDTLGAAYVFQPAGQQKLDAFFASLPADVQAKYGNTAHLFGPLFRELMTPMSNWLRVIERTPQRDGKLAYRVVSVDSETSRFGEFSSVKLLDNVSPPNPRGNATARLRRIAGEWKIGYFSESTADSLIRNVDPTTGEVRPHAVKDLLPISVEGQKREPGTPTP